MDLKFTKSAVVLVFTCIILSQLSGSNGEVPSKPSGGVTIVPAIKPASDDPQAYPEAEKASLPVFAMNYPRIQIPFEVTLWVLLASFAKIGEWQTQTRQFTLIDVFLLSLTEGHFCLQVSMCTIKSQSGCQSPVFSSVLVS